MLILYLVRAIRHIVLRSACSLHPQLTETTRYTASSSHCGMADLPPPSRPSRAYSRSFAGQIFSGMAIIVAATPCSCLGSLLTVPDL